MGLTDLKNWSANLWRYIILIQLFKGLKLFLSESDYLVCFWCDAAVDSWYFVSCAYLKCERLTWVNSLFRSADFMALWSAVRQANKDMDRTYKPTSGCEPRIRNQDECGKTNPPWCHPFQLWRCGRRHLGLFYHHTLPNMDQNMTQRQLMEFKHNVNESGPVPSFWVSCTFQRCYSPSCTWPT